MANSLNKVTTKSILDATVATADIADDAVTLAKMAGGTDGQIITYDASGNPTAVGPGSDGQVLTSTGAGSPPAFEAPAVTALNNATANELVTVGSTTTELDAETNLIYDGTSLIVGDTGTLSSAYQLQVTHATAINTILANSTTATSQEAALTFAPANSITGAQIICTSEEDFSSNSNRTARLEFKVRTNGTLHEAMRINSGGIVSAPNGIELGSGVDATTANTLNDYERGTFTPTVSSGVTNPTFGTVLGGYIKIGNQVHFQIYMNITGGTANSNQLKFGGLPFTSHANSDYGYGGATLVLQSSMFDQGKDVAFHVGSNETELKGKKSNGTNLAGNSSDVNDVTTEVTFVGQYQSNA